MSTLRNLCGPVFVFAGLNHFANPKPYEAIMPRYLPAHRELVYASGVAEAVGGLGLMIPGTRRRAANFLIATLLGVFPANLEMALHPERFPMIPGGRRTLMARLPLQLAFIAWVLWAAQADVEGR
ncbi:MAG TPA: hypothetical protein VFN48_09065 [Solirubrobacteraceae bacterium]|nr:hypothetical protein [Solirubrobacteraceae bacterium]